MRRLVWVGLLVGFLLNLFGWLGNNFLLGALWRQVNESALPVAWRASIWKDIFSFVPDYVYGFAIVWLYVRLRHSTANWKAAALQSGVFASIVGGITTYFAIANSGFIPWKVAFASFALVLGTKVPLAFLGGWLMEKVPKSAGKRRPAVDQ